MILIQREEKQRLWREYMATIGYSIGALICGALGGEFPIPSWGEFAHPELTKDDRSGGSIIEGLIDKLKGGGDANGLVQPRGEADSGQDSL